MLEEILIGGFGGQGIMLTGQLIAWGAMYEGYEVTFFPSYGPEMRGGTANCTVVISDQTIGSPVRSSFSVFTAMNQGSIEKFGDHVKPRGLLIYNDTLVQTPPVRDDVQVIKIPASQIASELGDLQVANMVALGGLAEALGIVSFASLAKGLMRVIPQYRHHMIALNKEAIRMGIKSVRMSLASGT